MLICSCENEPDNIGDGVGVAQTSATSAQYRAQGGDFARSKGLHMEEVRLNILQGNYLIFQSGSLSTSVSALMGIA